MMIYACTEHASRINIAGIFSKAVLRAVSIYMKTRMFRSGSSAVYNHVRPVVLQFMSYLLKNVTHCNPVLGDRENHKSHRSGCPGPSVLQQPILLEYLQGKTAEYKELSKEKRMDLDNF